MAALMGGRWLAGVLVMAAALGGGCEGEVPAGAGAPQRSASAAAGTSSPEAGADAPAAARRRTPQRSGQTIARAPTDDALFVADEDHRSVRAFALPIEPGAKPASVALSGHPAQLIALQDRVLVTVRDDVGAKGALVVLERDGALGLRELGKVSLPPDAWGLAVDAEEKTAVVSSAWSAKVSLVDLTTLSVRATLEVAREPRGVLVSPDGETAFVSHLVGSDVTRIDGLDGASPVASKIELQASPLRSPIGKRLPASLGYAIAASPEGDRLFFPRHALGGLSEDAWFGTAAVDVWLPARGAQLSPARSYGMPRTFVARVTSMPIWTWGRNEVISRGWDAFVQPRAVVYRASERTLLVASEGTNELVELDAAMMDPTAGVLRKYALARSSEKYVDAPTSGGAPSGVALSADESLAYVHCRSTDELAIVPLARGEGRYDDLPPRTVPLVSERAERSFALGKALFYDATDTAVSGGLACAGCHPEGRDDGHVWREVTLRGEDPDPFTNFLGSAEQLPELAVRWKVSAEKGVEGEVAAPRAVGFARQTPMLAGRVAAYGPYGWHGESKTLQARLVAGFGLHRWSKDWNKRPLDQRASFLVEFLREGLVPPPREERPLSPEEEQGRVLFESAATGCAKCHVPATEHTDRTSPPMSQPPPPPGFAREENEAFKTPSLRFVGGTPPYFHDGRFKSLEQLLEQNGDRMGTTSHLDEAGRRALAAYLRTL